MTARKGLDQEDFDSLPEDVKEKVRLEGLNMQDFWYDPVYVDSEKRYTLDRAHWAVTMREEDSPRPEDDGYIWRYHYLDVEEVEVNDWDNLEHLTVERVEPSDGDEDWDVVESETFETEQSFNEYVEER